MSNFTPTLYDILGRISREASQEDIKTAYRTLAKSYHPDKNPHDRAGAEERMAALNEAYSILSDPVKRANYNKELLEKDESIRRQEEAKKRYAKEQARAAKAQYTAKAHDDTASMMRDDTRDMVATAAGVALAGLALGAILAALLDEE